MSEQIGQIARAGELTRDAVLALSARHAEPAWMRAFRLAAWEAVDLLRQHFMTACVKPEETKFRALHAALWTGGAVLYIPEGVEVTRPLVSLTWIDADGLDIFPHTLVIAGRGSTATLITAAVSPPGELPVFSDSVAEVMLADGAQGRVVTLQEWGRNVVEVGIIRSI